MSSNKALPAVPAATGVTDAIAAQIKAMNEAVTIQLKAMSEKNAREFERINHKLGTQDQVIGHLKGNVIKLNNASGLKRIEKGELGDGDEDLNGDFEASPGVSADKVSRNAKASGGSGESFVMEEESQAKDPKPVNHGS